MKNYKNSDYAINKYAAGIIYRGLLRTEEVTLEGFLDAHPNLTRRDFQALKVLSDAIYLEQVYAEHNQTRKNISLDDVFDGREPAGIPLEEQYVERQDRQHAMTAMHRLLDSGQLTKTQRRRVMLYVHGGISLRQIADKENVSANAVAQSINAAMRKLKKHFNFF